MSQETGFFDCSHLIKAFKKVKGITPKQYRLFHKVIK
ncbi:AraC family transcriptional regulator [Lachnoclostridium sp.]|nr:AraC family transcriptional regulator [Lachnoclostridium sp.]